MTHINNQTQDLFALDTVQDLDNATAAAIHGGATIILYQRKNFKGLRVPFSVERAGTRINLGARGSGFNNQASSVVVKSGVWELRSGSGSRPGLGVTLRPGRYSRFTGGLDNAVSLLIAKFA